MLLSKLSLKVWMLCNREENSKKKVIKSLNNERRAWMWGEKLIILTSSPFPNLRVFPWRPLSIRVPESRRYYLHYHPPLLSCLLCVSHRVLGQPLAPSCRAWARRDSLFLLLRPWEILNYKPHTTPMYLFTVMVYCFPTLYVVETAPSAVPASESCLE